MNQISRSFVSLMALAFSAGRWFYDSVISPSDEESADGRALAPIRYDGDPTEIYLA